MMGERIGAQEALFYGFSLEGHVPQGDMLRSIDRFVNVGDIRQRLKPFYSDTGGPSIDPELMLRVVIVGYVMGISLVDPAARWTSAHGDRAHFAYCSNYLIDLDNAVIVDVEATPAIR